MIQLQVETTSVCNAKCHFCVYPTLERTRKHMAMPLYSKILNEAVPIPAIGQLMLTGLGEPLLDPHLDKRISMAKEVAPRLEVGIYTNGTFLTPKRFDSLHAAGVDTIDISLNAATAEQRKEIMGLDDWERVVANVQYALASQNGTRVLLKGVVNPDRFTKSDTEQIQRIWGNRVMDGAGRFLPVVEGNWAGRTRTIRAFSPSDACHRALGQIYVTVDGIVTTCCFDPDGRQVFGDLREQTLREVYNSSKYVQFREAHFENRADQYEICKGCTRI